MAGRKGRAFRTRSWFLLKDSVIFVLVMCLLHIQIQFVKTADSKSNTGYDRKQSDGNTGRTMAALKATTKTPPSPSPETQVTPVKTPPPLNWAVYPAKAANKSINSSKSSRNSTVRILKNIKIKGMSENVIRENIMLPSFDSEREAQLLYEKTLQEYHGGGGGGVAVVGAGSRSDNAVTDKTTPQQATTERTVHNICESWIARKCHCHGRMDRISLACRGLDMLTVPLDIPAEVVNLDLGNNNLTHLGDNSFYMVPNLEELTLSDNSLSDIHQNAFSGLVKLKRLSLQNCGLKVIPGDSFQGLPNLISLQLNGNSLASMDTDSLKHLQNLRTLRLEGNLFYRIPTNALAGLRSLEALNLGSNLLTIITDEDFPVMPNLIVLLLKRNQIMKTSPAAFTNITSLKVLELDDNLLTSLPEGLNKLTHLQELSASSNRLKWINETDLPKNLHTIDFRANPLKGIRRGAFTYMPRLRKL